MVEVTVLNRRKGEIVYSGIFFFNFEGVNLIHINDKLKRLTNTKKDNSKRILLLGVTTDTIKKSYNKSKVNLNQKRTKY